MRLHPRCVVVLMFLLVPTVAQAHDHVWDVAFGPATATAAACGAGASRWGLPTEYQLTRT